MSANTPPTGTVSLPALRGRGEFHPEMSPDPAAEAAHRGQHRRTGGAERRLSALRPGLRATAGDAECPVGQLLTQGRSRGRRRCPASDDRFLPKSYSAYTFISRNRLGCVRCVIPSRPPTSTTSRLSVAENADKILGLAMMKLAS